MRVLWNINAQTGARIDHVMSTPEAAKPPRLHCMEIGFHRIIRKNG